MVETNGEKSSFQCSVGHEGCHIVNALSANRSRDDLHRGSAAQFANADFMKARSSRRKEGGLPAVQPFEGQRIAIMLSGIQENSTSPSTEREGWGKPAVGRPRRLAIELPQCLRIQLLAFDGTRGQTLAGEDLQLGGKTRFVVQYLRYGQDLALGTPRASRAAEIRSAAQ